MTPSLFIVAVLLLFFGVVLPVAMKVAEDNRTSPYGSGAARRYLAALVRESELEPEKFAREGVARPPWVVFVNCGPTTDKWKADMVKAVARIAPDNVSITNYGTSICMSPKS